MTLADLFKSKDPEDMELKRACWEGVRFKEEESDKGESNYDK